MTVIITIAITILMIAFGQVLTKKGMEIAGAPPHNVYDLILFLLKNLLLNPYIVSGLVLAVISTLSWMYTLSKVELNYAYPFMSLNFPLVLLLSILLLGEHISLYRWAGIFIIMVGLIVVSKG